MFSAGCLIDYITSYTLQHNVTTKFPEQSFIIKDRFKFARYDPRTNQTEIISCPDGYEFDKDNLKCKLIDKPLCSSIVLPDPMVNPKFCYSGFLEFAFETIRPDPYNCMSFFRCFNGEEVWTVCNSFFLYNPDKKKCVPPEIANCCEYWEKDRTITGDNNGIPGQPGRAVDHITSRNLILFSSNLILSLFFKTVL